MTNETAKAKAKTHNNKSNVLGRQQVVNNIKKRGGEITNETTKQK